MSINTDAVMKLAMAIQVQEGWAPGTLSYRNNNPGNLRYVGQAGAMRGEGGFASYGSYSLGLAALIDQIQRNAVRGYDAAMRPVTTVEELIASWAPPSENDTAAYVASVTRQTGFGAGDLLLSLGAGGGADAAGDAASSGESGSVTLPALSPVTLAAVGVTAAAVLWLGLRG
jgi:hypothetical protein